MKKLKIIYEDKYLIIVNKSAGEFTISRDNHYDNNLYDEVKTYVKKQNPKDKIFIVHRLDKDTSGLMLVAKDDKAHEILADDFKNKRIHREYIALLDGVFPQEKAIVDAPIGRSKEFFDKMEVRSDGKKAITNIEVLKKYKDYTLVKLVLENASLIELQLETGRTHQIRVHLSYIGYPVHNDPVYSGKKCTEFGQFLHSAYLKFKHPITGEILEFEAKLPEEFENFIKDLEK